jgi:predicted AAA+ superfamily ATPase
MERKLMSELIKWKDKKGRKPLLLEGACQVGKTYLLKGFGKRYFKNVAYVNLQNPSAVCEHLLDYSLNKT